MIFLKLFWVFLKIGTLGFGGGYAMLSLIQEEVVKQQGWMTEQEFTDLIAVSQMTPGPIGINTATYAGYSALANAGYSPYSAVLGSLIATLALCIPSFVIIIIISRSLSSFRNNKHFMAVMSVIRPLSISLIAIAALSMMNRDNFIDPLSWGLFLGTLLLSLHYKLHPVKIIFIAALIGLVVY